MDNYESHEPVIKFLDPQPKENIGSLLKMFTADFFTLEMSMLYLYEKKKVTGVHDFLVNKLYSYKDHEIEFFIPQLCYLLIKYRSPTLEKFLMDKCTSNIPLFLKIFWCLQAYGQAEKKQKKGYEIVESFLKKAELAMVNGKPTKNPLGSPEKSFKLHDGSSIDRAEIMKAEFHRKKARSDYLANTIKFINIITAVSLKLKTVNPSERKLQLKLYVKRINKWLLTIRRKHIADKDEYFRKLFYGIHIPFSSTEEDDSTMIVNILEDEVTCFNTKKRAPYRIVVETVDMEEIGSMTSSSIRSKDRAHPSRGSRQISDMISGPTDPDSSLEEDAFQDLIEEQEKNKQTREAAIVDLLSEKDKFRGLEDFEKFLREEEAKVQDSKNLKADDLIHKYDFFQKVVTSHDEPTPAIKINGENKPQDEPRHKGSVSQAPLSQRRRSEAVDGRPDIGIRRSSSCENLDSRAQVKYLETFNDQHLSGSVHMKMDEVIQELKREAEEDYLPSHEDLKTVDDYPVKKENQMMGWGPWDELWEQKQKLIQQKSIFGHYKSYKLRCIIVKANDDLRQELIAMQIMIKMQNIWKEAGLTLKVRTYDILVTSEDSGILEFVPDTYSIDGVKKKYPGKSLVNFFKDTFGYDFEEAQKNFIDSLAAYCLICYFLQIKDRHNGNILIDAYGHIVHIDFGFILCTSPGGINFESAPFKLTHEYVEMMGGSNSNTFTYFKLQLTKGFMELRKHVKYLVYFVQTMMEASDLTCFENFNFQEFIERFKEGSTDEEVINHVSRLVDLSNDNWRTVQYDNFQKYTNGIMP